MNPSYYDTITIINVCGVNSGLSETWTCSVLKSAYFEKYEYMKSFQGAAYNEYLANSTAYSCGDNLGGIGASNTSQEYLEGWTGFVNQVLYIIGFFRYNKSEDDSNDCTQNK